MNVHFSSKKDQWETPREFFDHVNRIYKLDIDVCADEENTKLPRHWNEYADALSKDWTDIRGWMNPPYGRQIGKWIEKAATGGGFNCCGPTSRAHRH